MLGFVSRGTHEERAANDRDYTHEIVPLAETILFKILAPEHRGLSAGTRLHKGDTAASQRQTLSTSLGQRTA